MSESLEASYRWCKQRCRESGSSFCWTFGLLGRDASMGMYALYAFARITDDLADGLEPTSQKSHDLREWRQQLLSHCNADCDAQQHESPLPDQLKKYDSLWLALNDTVAKFDIPLHLLEAVVHGVNMDIDHRQPKDWHDLDDYCYHVASAVGLACTKIWEANISLPQQIAVDCGIAFQLTNILRDIADDARHGRIYLPLSEFECFGVTPASWLRGGPEGEWSEMVLSIAARAEVLYKSGWEMKQFLPPKSQRVFSLMWRSYHELLQQVCRHREQLWVRKRLRIPSVTRAPTGGPTFHSATLREARQPPFLKRATVDG